MPLTEPMPAHEVEPISDAELTALALAAADAEVPDDAVPWRPGDGPQAILADWYMPAATTGRRDWRARVVAGAFIASLVLINGAGLCVTYGRVILG
jgi:hypothetical protein